MRITESRLRQLVKEALEMPLAENLLQEGVFQDAVGWIKKKGAAAKDATVDFLTKFKSELEETAEGAELLVKIVQGKSLTPEEKDELKTQAQDVGKGLPLLALLALPGGGIATIALVKLANKFDINLMPSAFRTKRKKTKRV